MSVNDSGRHTVTDTTRLQVCPFPTLRANPGSTCAPLSGHTGRATASAWGPPRRAAGGRSCYLPLLRREASPPSAALAFRAG